MITKFRRIGLATGALAAVLAVATPALAQNHGSGHVSGGGSFSGGHSYSGGGHAAGGHASGGRAYSYSGGGRAMGGGPHLAPSGHYGGGYTGGYGHSGGYVGGYGHSGSYAHGGGTWGGGWHGGNWGGGYRGGYWGGWHGGFWGGGYWGGGFWPRAYYGVGFPWFLPVLPLAYATYWWDGFPYYYANNVYYTWNPTYDGYVVTDPPPVSGGVVPGSAAAPAAGDQIVMYPKNGQSDAQLATDRNECQQWASSQASGGGDDYRRAMSACAEARGYSTQ